MAVDELLLSETIKRHAGAEYTADTTDYRLDCFADHCDDCSQQRTIGFVGLIIPHITRLLFGPDNGRVHFYSFSSEAFFACDTLARTVVGP